MKLKRLTLIVLFLIGFANWGLTSILSAQEQINNPVAATAPDNNPTLSLEQITETFHLLKTQHISPPENDQLIIGAIKGMLQAVKDPYTAYMEAEEIKRIYDSEQNFTGIGTVIFNAGNGLYLEEVYSGSPAARTGLRVGDLLVAVNSKALTGLTVEEAAYLVRGEAGTKVRLTVQRLGRRYDYEVTRSQVNIPFVSSKFLPGKVGYLKLELFNSDTASIFTTALQELKTRNINGLVLDLRDNPGGTLDAAGAIGINFLDQGVLMQIQDGVGQTRPMIIQNGSHLGKPMVILVNERTASAAEVLAGALQDYQLATLLGAPKTYGKGSMQEIFPLSKGSGSLKITTNYWLTPRGRAINGAGLTTDKVVQDDGARLAAALKIITPGLNNSLVYEIGLPRVNVAGEDLLLLPAPFREAGNTYLPLRLTLEAIGYELQVDLTQKLLIIRNGTILKKVKMNDANLRIIGGKTMVRASFLRTIPRLRIDVVGSKVVING